MVIGNETGTAAERLETIAKNWIWFLLLGIALIVLGFIAIGSPYYGTVAGTRVFGWVLLFTGISAGVHAGAVRGWGGVILQLLVTLVHFAGGLWLLIEPVTGALTLTMLLIIVLFAQGLISIVEAIQVRPAPGWLWILGSGIASIVLGTMLLQKFPSSALWAIGLLFGLSLVLNGWSFRIDGARRSALAAMQPLTSRCNSNDWASEPQTPAGIHVLNHELRSRNR